MKRVSGFTLLEVLVIVAILALVTGTLLQGMRFGLTASRTRDRQAAESAEMEAADRIIRELIEQSAPGTEANPPSFSGTPHTLTLRSDLPLAAGSAAKRHIDAALGIDPQHRLTLRWVPYLHADYAGPPPEVRTAVLATGLDHAEFQYWGRGRVRDPLAWSESWRGDRLPLLIRIRLVFSQDAHRSWPDILAAPRAAAPDR